MAVWAGTRRVFHAKIKIGAKVHIGGLLQNRKGTSEIIRVMAAQALVKQPGDRIGTGGG